MANDEQQRLAAMMATATADAEKKRQERLGTDMRSVDRARWIRNFCRVAMMGSFLYYVVVCSGAMFGVIDKERTPALWYTVAALGCPAFLLLFGSFVTLFFMGGLAPSWRVRQMLSESDRRKLDN